MPLTAQDKNAIAQGGVQAGVLSVSSAAGLGALGTGGIGILALPLVLGITAHFSRVRFPRIDPLAALRAARPLQRRGLQTRISADPFFGDTVVSTVDQDPHLDELVFRRAERRFAATQDFSPIARQRQAVIEGLRETAVERGFRSSIDPSLRGGVFRETADSPLQFIEGEFLA